MPALIEVENLSFSYRQFVALKGVSFTVDAGSRYGLIGPNGGGKSTIMKLLATVLPLPSSAADQDTAPKIRFFGRDLRQNARAVRCKIGVVFQTSTLDKKLTIAENLTLMGKLQGVPIAILPNKISELAQHLDLVEKLSARVETLSGGLKRRAELALALLHSPEVLLLDEPTSGLDPLVRQDFWRLLDGVVKASGTTVVMATHLMDEAEYCDRLALIDGGRVLAEGTPQSFAQQAGGDLISVFPKKIELIEKWVRGEFSVAPVVIGNRLQFEHPNGRNIVALLMEKWGHEINSIAVSHAGLESFFIRSVAHRKSP